jgi:signal transduction histidine kinase
MKLKILHLEDNADDVELVRHSLRRQGVECDVHAVSTGQEYVSALDAHLYDVILSDSGLPGYDGRAALAAAQERCPGVPFIVVSGAPQAPTPAEKASSPPGAAAHVAKANMKQLGAVSQFALQKAEPAHREPVEREAYVLGMKLLVSVVQRLSMARNLESIMAIVRRAVRDLTGADGATFVLREADECYYADEDAISPLWKGKRFPLQACISGWTILNRQPAIIEDIYADPRIPHDAYRPTFVKSLVMMPVRTASPIGAIGAYWARRRQPTSHEVELLQALADSTSIAMEAVDLFRNLERRVIERTEDLNRHAAALKTANQELEAFSHSVAHDLRSPLVAIEGFRQVLLESCAQTFDEDGREYLARIGSSVTRMHRLIEDLLSLSKVSLAPMARQRLDLAPVAREIICGLVERSAKREVRLSVIGDLGVEGDAALLRILLENLLSNAWKFTSRRQAGEVEIGATTDASGTRTFFVRDNGAGFDSRHAEKLFRPFSRLHTQAEFPGSGIGLAIVQRIVHRHGGRLWAEAQPDRGATFNFTLSPAVTQLRA